MDLKRAFSDEGNDNSQLTNSQSHEHLNPTEVCWCRGASNLMEVKWVQDLMALFRSSMREEVEDAFKRLILPHLLSLQISAPPSTSSCHRSLPHQAESSSSRCLRLQFVGPLPDSLFTLNNIQDQGASLKIELHDNSGSRVQVGPESCVKVKIVVLDGDFAVEDRDDWTDDEFKKNIAPPRKTKGPLLKGEYEISMCNGVAIISDLAFTDNSKSMRNGNFRLGAQVIRGLPHGVVVRGAVSKAFKVKERRLQSCIKHKTPKLEDDIWRLNHIWKNGPICQRLADRNIYTVRDFLQLYHTDAMTLQNIICFPEMKWLQIVKHAKSCLLTKDAYRLVDNVVGVNLLLDCVFDIVSVTFKDQISQLYGDLDDSQKELVDKIRSIAYGNRSKLVKTYIATNQISMQAELICPPSILCTNMQYLDATEPDHQGEPLLDVNNYSPIPMLYPVGNEDGYQLQPTIDQMQDLYPHQMFDSDSWDFPPILEESSNLFEASANNHVASKLKAACYGTKAAIMFMISIQQHPPKKKQKL